MEQMDIRRQTGKQATGKVVSISIIVLALWHRSFLV